jgi:hypothetical protein
VAHRGGTLGLLVAIAIGTTAWAATDGTGAQKASPGATPARVQVLRIVEAKQGAQPETKVLSKSKKVARQKVIEHRPVLTHQRAPTVVPGVASKLRTDHDQDGIEYRSGTTRGSRPANQFRRLNMTAPDWAVRLSRPTGYFLQT